VGNPRTLEVFQKMQSLRSCLWDNGLDMSLPRKIRVNVYAKYTLTFSF